MDVTRQRVSCLNRDNSADKPQGKTKERMRDEKSPNVIDRCDDCVGKQFVVRMPLVATAGAPHAAGFAATPSAAADSGSVKIICQQISDIS
jgi:hypothetical protein